MNRRVLNYKMRLMCSAIGRKNRLFGYLYMIFEKYKDTKRGKYWQTKIDDAIKVF